MSNYEQLKARIEQIKQEAARKQEEVRCKARLEKEKERRVEPNWNLVKEETLKIFKEVNRVVFNSQGRIIGWEEKPFFHEYDYEWSEYEGSPEWSRGGYEKGIESGKVEIAELRLYPIGKVCVYRTLHYENKVSCGTKRRHLHNDYPDFFHIEGCGDFDEIPNSTGSFISESFSLALSEWSFDLKELLKEITSNSIAETIRRAVSDVIKDLYSRKNNPT